ncbi:MAG: hypothetical protein ABR970_14415 [Roseiarcus sp.]
MPDATSPEPIPEPDAGGDRRHRSAAGENGNLGSGRVDEAPASGADPAEPGSPADPEREATPNRDRRHEPPVIEGMAIESRESDPRLGAGDAAEAASGFGDGPVADQRTGSRASLLLSAAIGALAGAAAAGAVLGLVAPRSAADPELVARLESLEKAPRPEAQSAAIAALDRRVAAVEAASAGAPDRAVLDGHGQRLAALEASALAAKAASDAGKNALTVAQTARDDAAKALALASARGEKGDSGPAPATQPGADPALDDRLGRVEAGLAALGHGADELAAINQRLDALDKALAAPKTETRAPAEAAASNPGGAELAVVAQALLDRLRAGAPFPVEEAALERLGADPVKLAALKPLAERGAPSAAALATDFSKVAPAALAAATPASSGGVMDRLLANMSKVVRVTPIGELAGEDPVALISQVGAALARGQVEPAVGSWARLPEAAREASRAWANEAQSRLAADKAAQDILEDAMARLAAARN